MSCGLLQLIKRDNTVIQERPRIDRGLHPVWVTVKQTHAECVFHISDYLRDRGLRDGEFPGSLSHATAPGHSEQDMKIPQLHATAHALLVPIHRATHQKMLCRH